jgi:integrase/recombinase XerC
LGCLFAGAGVDHPARLTEADLLAYCTAGNPANNTVYQRTTKVLTFLRWCERSGLIETNPGARLRDRDSALRVYRRTYGKVQARNPGRWLTYAEAFVQLVGACQDSTVLGLRDEVVIRLGLTGLRVTEIAGLSVDNLRHAPTLTWTGKGHTPRQATLGTALMNALDRYLDAYPNPSPDAPLVCCQVQGATRRGGPPRIDWHHRIGTRAVYDIVTSRARLASLGHVAPHDLRRSAAGILHTATGDDGAHHFDLLDIQRVLGHSDPATTMRSYLAPMETGVLDRAACFLD